MDDSTIAGALRLLLIGSVGLGVAGCDTLFSDAPDATNDSGTVDGAVMDVGDDADAEDVVDTSADVGPDGGDTVTDTGRDTGTDTGTDIGMDTGTDTGLDTGIDTGTDIGLDTGIDTGTDSGLDTGNDTDVGDATGGTGDVRDTRPDIRDAYDTDGDTDTDGSGLDADGSDGRDGQGNSAACNPSSSSRWVDLIGRHNVDRANDVDTDSNGTVYVVGSASLGLGGQSISGGGQDGFVAHYNSSGTRNGSWLVGTSGLDKLYGVAVGPNGNLYVAGATTGAFGSQVNNGKRDAFVAKYGSNGNRQWVDMRGGSGKDRAVDVAVDGNGRVYVAGSTASGLGNQTYNGGPSDAFLARYDSWGNRKWIRVFGSSGRDAAGGVSASTATGAYVAGLASRGFGGQSLSGGPTDAFLVRYASGGKREWVRLLGSSNGVDLGRSVTVSSGGTVYIAGDTRGSFGGRSYNGGLSDTFVAAYGTTGNRSWVRLAGTSERDWSGTVALTSTGAPLLVGRTEGGLVRNYVSGQAGIFAMELSSAGKKGKIRVAAPCTDARPASVTAHGGNDTYIVGSTTEGFGGATKSGADHDGFLVNLK